MGMLSSKSIVKDSWYYIFPCCMYGKHFNPANIHLDEDVLKTSFVFVFRRGLDQDQYSRLGHKSSRGLQDIFNTSCNNVFKTFSRRIIKLNCSC